MATTKTTTKTKTVKAKKEVVAGSLEAKVYGVNGKEVSTITLPAEVFGRKKNSDLVHQVITSMLSNARAGTAHTKTRGEVRGGGKKPWKQKGTGRARHGSTRSPIWKGGGVTHGPRVEKNYSRTINKKMRVAALFTALSDKFRSGNVLFVEKLALSDAKTKSGAKVVAALSKVAGFERLAGKKVAAFVAFPGKDDENRRALRNIASLEIGSIKDLNPVDVFSTRYLVITAPEESLKMLSSKVAK